MRKRLVILSVLLFIVIGIGFLGYRKYQENKIMSAIYPHIKNTSLRVSNALGYETESSKITYKELLEKLEADIAEIDKRLLEVQTLSTGGTKEKISVVVSYLKGSLDLIRAQLMMNRKLLAYKSSVTLAGKVIDLYQETSYYGREFALRTMNNAVKDMEKERVEAKEAAAAFLGSAKKLTELRAKTAEVIPSENLIESALLEKIIKQQEDRETKSPKES